MAAFDQGTLNQLEQGYQATKPAPVIAAKPKGPGGLKGFLTNALPAIGGGIGAIAGLPGDFFSAGASSVGGGALGAGVGEAIKRKILGENEDPKQIAIQAAEGGALSGIGSGAKAITNGAKAFAQGGVKAAAKTAASDATEKEGSSFFKNLTTQGQQAQGRVAGVSAGSKVAGKELTPQDTEQMLNTLKNEGIKTGNANNTLRDIQDKLKGYGQQINDHFKTNDAPLKPDDTKVIADNFIKGIGTTDPAVLKQAQIIADDLEKNVTSTKGLWDFRKELDSRIPDSKFNDAATTAKVTALKSARKYITDELGNVPKAANYHDLSEIKPFVSGEAKRLNNPSGGVLGRLASSGPVQKTENAIGKATEKIGQAGAKETPQAVDTMSQEAVANAPKPGFISNLVSTAKASANPVELARTAAAPLGSPGATTASVLKQFIGRGAGIPAAISNQPQGQSDDSTNAINAADTLLQSSAASPQASNDPFDPSNIQANTQAILQQGGTLTDVTNYLTAVKSYQALTTPTGSTLNATQQQQANNANSALQDIQSLSGMLSQDPSLSAKAGIPFASNSVVQRLTGTTDYEAARNNIVDVISRLRSGAAISASEEKLYKSLLPQAGDTNESANSKLQRLTQLFQSFATPQSSSGSDVTDLLANSGQ